MTAESPGGTGSEAPSSRRWAVAAVVAVLAVGASAFFVTRPQPGGEDGGRGGGAAGPDALEARILGELDGFLGWLDTHDVDGAIGEVSWPSDDPGGKWADLGRRWFERTTATDTPVAYWAAGEVWDQEEIPYLAYAASGGTATPVDTVLGPGRVLADVEEVGLNSAGGSYNACSRQETCDWFHNEKRGRLGQEWQFDTAATFAFYARQGISWVRLPIRWERLQPELGGPLDEEVATALGSALDQAHAAGLGVVLDLHNFGAYYEFDGTTGVRRALGVDLGSDALVDVWRRVLERFGPHPAVAAWGIMNEPVDMGDDGRRRWEAISQDVVDALRSAGDRREVWVAGYDLGNVATWVHDRPWIEDPAGLVRYEAHHHWDRHHGAEYEATYDQERREAAVDGG